MIFTLWPWWWMSLVKTCDKQCSNENKILNNWKSCINKRRRLEGNTTTFKVGAQNVFVMGQWYGLGRKETIFGSNDVDGNADFSSLVYKKKKGETDISGKPHIRKYWSRLNCRHRWSESTGLRGDSNDSLPLGTPANGNLRVPLFLLLSVWEFQMWGQLKKEVIWS